MYWIILPQTGGCFVFDAGGKQQIEHRFQFEAGKHDLAIDQVNNLGAGLYVGSAE